MIPPPPRPPDPGKLEETLFPPSSRYHGLQALKATQADGREVVYVERRFLPPHELQQVVDEHSVTQGERLDNLAAQYLGDPQAFWRMCDGNHQLDPFDLTRKVGRILNITLPPSTNGSSDA